MDYSTSSKRLKWVLSHSSTIITFKSSQSCLEVFSRYPTKGLEGHF
nr:MAG TPA: hypothetical protein [Caudoviricetes sp.]